VEASPLGVRGWQVLPRGWLLRRPPPPAARSSQLPGPRVGQTEGGDGEGGLLEGPGNVSGREAGCLFGV
jgi:hypothetical protein